MWRRRWTLEWCGHQTRRRRGVASLLGPRGAQPCRHLDFGLLPSTSVREHFCLSRCLVCGIYYGNPGDNTLHFFTSNQTQKVSIAGSWRRNTWRPAPPTAPVPAAASDPLRGWASSCEGPGKTQWPVRRSERTKRRQVRHPNASSPPGPPQSVRIYKSESKEGKEQDPGGGLRM